jgi:hypothetical protein
MFIFFSKALTLNNCGGDSIDKVAEVVRGSSSNVFTCSGLSSDAITWSIRRPSDSNDVTVSYCPNPTSGDSCGSESVSHFDASRTTSSFSTMTINPTDPSFDQANVAGTQLRCGDTSSGGQSDSCTMDLISEYVVS